MGGAQRGGGGRGAGWQRQHPACQVLARARCRLGEDAVWAPRQRARFDRSTRSTRPRRAALRRRRTAFQLQNSVACTLSLTRKRSYREPSAGGAMLAPDQQPRRAAGTARRGVRCRYR